MAKLSRIRIRSPRKCKAFATIDPGRKGHIKNVICITKQRSGARGGSSRIQNIMFPRNNSEDKNNAFKLARRAGCKQIVRKGIDYACKPLLK